MSDYKSMAKAGIAKYECSKDFDLLCHAEFISASH